jgi:hypothetical protein
MLTREDMSGGIWANSRKPRRNGDNRSRSRTAEAPSHTPSLDIWGGGPARGFVSAASRIGLGLVLLLVLLPVGGCNTELALQPAEGLVTLDGEPVADAAVLFQPLNSDGPPSHGTTDEAGKFSLTTNNRPGVKVGKYRVAVSKVEMPNLHQTAQTTGEGEKRVGFLDEGQLKEVYLLPKQYVDVMTSALTADVQGNAKNYFTFSLTSDDTMGESGSTSDKQSPAPAADEIPSEPQDSPEVSDESQK